MFPNLPFAIVFTAVLMAGLGYAAYVDWVMLKIPKWLTIGLFGSGIVMNMVRGGWLAAEGQPVWIINGDNAALGALDGFLLALAGFITGFGVFFVFWIFGLGGGGDVKLVGATGAWIGWLMVLMCIALSLPFLVVVTVLVSAWRITSGKLPTTAMQGGSRRRTVTTFSLPFALGVAVMMSLLMVRYVNSLAG
jgi:prepilin peptidase CpaA